MRIIFRLSLFLCLILFFGCKNKENIIQNNKTVTIGTFNIAWLGDGIRDRIDRIEDNYREIAQIIVDSDMDIIGLQEIENQAAMYRLIKYLPQFSFYIGKKGKAQNTAVLFKKDIEVELLGEYMPLAVEKNRNRPGLLLKVKKGNFDWLMMVVHLKSTSRYDDSEDKIENSFTVRKKQADILSFWADSVINKGTEKDIIIVGDFNDNPIKKNRTMLDRLAKNSNLEFMTNSLKSCKFNNLPVIDHIILSKSAKRRFIPNSTFIYDIYSALPEDRAKLVSDHCPVSIMLEVQSEDND